MRGRHSHTGQNIAVWEWIGKELSAYPLAFAAQHHKTATNEQH